VKKMIIVILGFFVSGLIYAAELAKLNFNIAEVKKDRPHFLCIYNTGCFNLLSLNKNRNFSIPTNELANINRIAIADSKTRKLYLQAMPASCQVTLPAKATITLTGKMAMNNAVPVIQDLHCQVKQAG
jgi:hypothetical protein